MSTEILNADVQIDIMCRTFGLARQEGQWVLDAGFRVKAETDVTPFGSNENITIVLPDAVAVQSAPTGTHHGYKSVDVTHPVLNLVTTMREFWSGK